MGNIKSLRRRILALFFTALVLIAGLALNLSCDSITYGITEYAIPTTQSVPGGITAGPDGAVWFSEEFANKIGRITTGGEITEYTIPTAKSIPNGITSGPDGALWFCENQSSKVVRMTTNGRITEYKTPTQKMMEKDATIFGSFPTHITSGPKNTLWFTENVANKIGRIGEKASR